jgi:hypothetical protein
VVVVQVDVATGDNHVGVLVLDFEEAVRQPRPVVVVD